MFDFTSLFNGFINTIFNLIGYIVNLVLTPIYILVDNGLSLFGISLDNINATILDFFRNITNFANWVLSYSGLSQDLISIYKACWVFLLTVPLGVYAVKLAIRWYNVLKV